MTFVVQCPRKMHWPHLWKRYRLSGKTLGIRFCPGL